MEKTLVKTQFIAMTDISVIEMTGGGWNASFHSVIKEKKGGLILCETYQTPDSNVQDNSVRLTFSSGEKITYSFENLGRLVACRALVQQIS